MCKKKKKKGLHFHNILASQPEKIRADNVPQAPVRKPLSLLWVNMKIKVTFTFIKRPS